MSENTNEIEQMIPLLVQHYMFMAEYASDLAYCRRTLYEAYLLEGFEPAQALELCKNL
jgi:hypothetical protein